MKLLKIDSGLVINCDNIAALESKDQLHTRIYMVGGEKFIANFPVDSIVTIIDHIDESGKETIKNLNAMLKTSGNFSG